MGLDDTTLSRTLDEAFGAAPPPRTKSGTRRQHKSPDRGGASGGNVPQRGIARQKSQRRDKIAAAVSLMAGAGGDSGSNLEEQAVAREQRRRRAKHEDRLQAAQMENIASGVIGLGHGGREMDGSHSHNEDRDRHHEGDRERHERRLRHEERYKNAFSNNSTAAGGGGGDRNHRQQEQHVQEEDLGYDDYDLDESQDDDYGYSERDNNNRRERQPRAPRERRPRRASNDDDRHMHHYHSEDASETGRRPRAPGRNTSKSFDESMTNMRARGRRRASMVGGSETAIDREDFRARRGRRASMAAEASVGNMSVRTEPAMRGVRESRSGEGMRRMRRPSDANIAPGLRRQRTNESGSGGGDESERFGAGLDYSYNEEYDQEKQEWAEKRSEKQRAMLAKLRSSNSKQEEQPQQAEEASLADTLQGDEEPAPETSGKSGRKARAGLSKAFGMSSSNFALVDEDDKKNQSFRRKGEAPRKGGPPSRSKSTDGPVQGSGAAIGGRARATDTDRRRRGTMLDRIGA